MTGKIKIRKGDKVKVILGKDRGRIGVVKKILPKKNQIIVEGMNMVKKHVKPAGKDKPGGIVDFEKPLWASKVMVICPQCGRPTRIGYQLDKSGKKYRICRQCRSLIESVKVKTKK